MALVPTQISCSCSLQVLFAGVFLVSEVSAAVVACLAGFRFSVEYFLKLFLEFVCVNRGMFWNALIGCCE